MLSDVPASEPIYLEESSPYPYQEVILGSFLEKKIIIVDEFGNRHAVYKLVFFDDGRVEIRMETAYDY